MNFSGVTISGAYLSILAPPSPATVEYLIVGGGASGASAPNIGGGGGGAGGLVTSPSLPITLGTTYTVTIGAGGINVTGNSTFNSNLIISSVEAYLKFAEGENNNNGGGPVPA
jgi:hypothetical protein